MTRHGHGRADASIESGWMDVREVPMRSATCGPVLDGMTERVVMADDISRLGMAPRHKNHIKGDRADTMRCDVPLRNFGPE